MIPYDGTGYGRSIYWETKTKQVARKNHEYCPCWDFISPIIKLSKDGEYQIKVKCYSKCDTCVSEFPKTNEKMTFLFRRFYKG